MGEFLTQLFMGFGWMLIGGAIGSKAARLRGESQVEGTLLGAVLGIFAVLLYIQFLIPAEDPTKVCPDCAERVKSAVRVCRYCHHRFAVAPTPAPRPESAPAPPRATPAKPREYWAHCRDAKSNVEGVEVVRATSEAEAITTLADRGKVVIRMVAGKDG
jgi:hypothetical protein